jgi:hypothetical protein
MRRYLTYTFPAGNTSDVCKVQNITGAGNLTLNGNLTNEIASEVNFLTHGYSRSISLSSANNLSGVTFTINGLQNGEKITEVITGPNATTKYGDEIYDVITSISATGAANGISIGTGHSGYFPLLNINLQRAVINYSLSTFKLTTNSIPTVIVNTLDNIAQNGIKFTDALDSNVFIIKTLSTDAQYILPPVNVIPCHSIVILIEGDQTTIANSIRMNFIQV